MRKQFMGCTRRSLIVAQCPWACKIVKVDGGYLAFESLKDYQTWKEQR